MSHEVDVVVVGAGVVGLAAAAALASGVQDQGSSCSPMWKPK